MNSDKKAASHPPLVWTTKKTLCSTVQSVKKLPDFLKLRLKFGLFCQVPFPSWQSAKGQSWVTEVVLELLENDAIAFQAKDSVTNFMNYCKECLHFEVSVSDLTVRYRKRYVKISAVAVPLPIDRYQNLVKAITMDLVLPPFETSYITRADLLCEESGNRMMKRFAEFDQLIRIEPSLRGLVSLIQYILIKEDALKEICEPIEEMVAEINGRFSRTKWTPIVLMYGNPDQKELKPFFDELEYMATFGLEGNPVEKEFLLYEVKSDPKILSFSPFSGVVSQMKESFLKKGKQEAIAKRLFKNFMMPDEKRLQLMKVLKYQRVPFLKQNLMRYLLFAADNLVALEMEEMIPITMEFLDQKLSQLISGSKPLTVIADFDGTLVPLPRGEESDVVSSDAYDILRSMAYHPRICIIIVSGRDPADVQELVKAENITFVGNHGLSIIYSDGSRWDYPVNKDFTKIVDLMDDLYVEACMHGAHFTNRGASLVYHYRHVLPVYRKDMYEKTWRIAKGHGFNVFKWKRELEIRLPVNIYKGEACVKALEFLYGDHWTEETQVFYVGDEKSDEAAMRVLGNHTALTGVRVTNGHFPKTLADFTIPSPECVHLLLQWLQANVPRLPKSFSTMAYF